MVEKKHSVYIWTLVGIVVMLGFTIATTTITDTKIITTGFVNASTDLNVTDLYALNLESNLDGTGFNITGSWGKFSKLNATSNSWFKGDFYRTNANTDAYMNLSTIEVYDGDAGEYYNWTSIVFNEHMLFRSASSKPPKLIFSDYGEIHFYNDTLDIDGPEDFGIIYDDREGMIISASENLTISSENSLTLKPDVDDENAGDNYVRIKGNVSIEGNVSITNHIVIAANTSAVTCTEGAIFFDTNKNKHYGCDGTAWQAFY